MKRKHKEHYIIYKGQSIAVNSPYSYKHCKVVLFYCPIEGVEFYFTAVKYAKRYLDAIHWDRLGIKPLVTTEDIPW